MQIRYLLIITIAIFSYVMSDKIINLNNPRIIRPEHYSLETYFPTPSIVVLEKSSSGDDFGTLHYYCANHKYPLKNNQICDYGTSFSSFYKTHEQPCDDCLTTSYDSKYINNEWMFNTEPPINWKNPLTKIKDFDKLIKPYEHGYTVDDIDIVEINKHWSYPHWSDMSFSSAFQKNNYIISYLKQWYYKVPDFNTKQLDNPFWGIHYKVENHINF